MKSLFDGLKTQKLQQKKAAVDKALLHYEARVGGKLFGPIPEGSRREFFCLDERTWIWHEEWLDANGQRHAMTTRYDVREHDILKSQGGASHQKLKLDEARRFAQAVSLYSQQVRGEYNRLLQA